MKNELSYTTEKVYKNEKTAEGIYKLEIQGKFKGKPGQFYMLRCWKLEPLLSRPISVHYLDTNKIVFLYQVVGQGTEKLSKLKTGDEIKLLGPLGNGFDIENLKTKTAIITGGIGIAPMFYLAQSIRKQHENCKLDLYAGFRDSVYSIDKFKPFVDDIHIYTETGTQGTKGYVTDEFRPELYDTVLCCGPEVMMKKVISMCRKKQVTVYVSMENRMACGVGACLVCTCSTIKGNKRACKDGPVFLGSDIVL
ncbi:dihydroorotate dehydrogenase electron transfer subunit [Clostridium sp. 001]|uniref:dihydroorotate dehydrogenase electron transfer subunit n=1 Tax=Clostridium sp. 001 TaxID=1970093 RepID=UPI001C2C0209|nr:dihydroorotate dehydrogenase electron transfer subunit [Clostridium sp. 001]QXE18642.1 dihydroorotate dehydrogenase electron transfer subunit [Clostridium sp. 001]